MQRAQAGEGAPSGLAWQAQRRAGWRRGDAETAGCPCPNAAAEARLAKKVRRCGMNGGLNEPA